MSAIRLFPLFAGILFVTRPVWANEQADCAANAGTLLVGTVASGPTFARGHERRGVELSHTHVRLRGDDGRSYDIAIDNIFAEGYDQAGEHVPRLCRILRMASVSNFAASRTPAERGWIGCTAIVVTIRRLRIRMAG